MANNDKDKGGGGGGGGGGGEKCESINEPDKLNRNNLEGVLLKE